MVYLKDTIKEGMKARFDQLRAMGIKTVMVTGDNRLTAAKIAEESGVDDFLAEATPERKLALIREQQQDGRLVAMTGDGTNDAPALAQADVGVAMNTGTQAAREAGNMVDLDSNPTKLIEIVEVGKQLLITRGALTTFSIANDVAKYFAILPAMFISTYAATSGRQGPAARAQHHGPRHAPQRDRLGDHLQRDRDPAADPAVAARRALPADRRQRAAAAQPVDLRPRRDHRAVHRHQADRPDRAQPARRVSDERVATGACAARLQCVAADQSRGRLKVFIGMAAGVGKTYRMLLEGHAELEAGHDVVIGLLETHGRDETARVADGLPIVPRRRVELSRARRSKRWTCPAILRRAPELCLIDELAHTNVPGAEHAKRYEDIEAVLAAGIDVLSTLNVQHLESLNDHITELSGIRVRETIPDAILGRADEVVLIDLTPEALLDRLRAGKVYPPERIDAALNNFFKIENLAALREVALRQVAEEVGRQAPDHRARRLARGEPRRGCAQAVGERLLALVEPYPGAQRLVRRAWRSAQRLGAELDLLWVRAPGKRLSEDEQRSLAALRQLASVLGARMLEEESDDLAAAIVEVAAAARDAPTSWSAARARRAASRACACRCPSG